MSVDEYERIKRFRVVYIFPFVTSTSDDKQAAFGAAFSHQMIRNLMLLNDVSIRGPEDTPRLESDRIEGILDRANLRFVTGVASRRGSLWSLNYSVYQNGEKAAEGNVTEKDFPQFVRACTETLAKAIDSDGVPTRSDAWDKGQPPSSGALLKYGSLLLNRESLDKRQKSAKAIELLKSEPAFSLPAWQMDNDFPECRPWYFEALKRDPYDAQTCFEAFCSVSAGGKSEPHAVQFCRRAIELSPGHGKAHMCAPHSAHPDVNMLRHSHLGYVLLQANTFAVSNYVQNLRKYGASAESLIGLANEGIANDPHSPFTYQQMIDLFISLQEWHTALTVAVELQKLFEPEIHPRALYCLRQSPNVKKQLDDGQYDPAAHNRRLIDYLRSKALGNS